MAGSRKKKSLQPRPRRRGRLLNVWVPFEQKDRLNQLAKKTHVNQSEIVRKALDMFFDQFDHGQLTLGFPDNQPVTRV